MFEQAAAAIGGSALSFGSNYASMLLSADIQRDLRRKQYQDQMHSMKSAGLNPILAYGGSPAAGSSPTMKGIEDVATSASNLMSQKSQRDLMKVQEKTAEAAARKADAEADTAEVLRDSQRAELDARARGHDASAGLNSAKEVTENDNREGLVRLTHRRGTQAQASAEADMQRKFLTYEQRITERDLREYRRRLMDRQSAAADASAYERRQRGLSVERDQPEYLVGEEGGRVWRGANKGIETLGSGARAAVGLVPRGRSIDVSAKRVRRPTPTSPVGKNSKLDYHMRKGREELARRKRKK